MLLLAVATENEIKPLQQFLGTVDRVEVLVTGMGPVAAAVSLGRYLARQGAGIDGVLNIGVAGGYVDSGPTMLDVCMAQQEFLGDFGICVPDGIQDFAPGLAAASMPSLCKNVLSVRFADYLEEHNMGCKSVNFVTVNCSSGTRKRGDFLRDKFVAGCENMEGAAVAMVCDAFNIAWVEMRCVSNMVQDRDIGNWQLTAAIEKICLATEIVLSGYMANCSSGVR